MIEILKTDGGRFIPLIVIMIIVLFFLFRKSVIDYAQNFDGMTRKGKIANLKRYRELYIGMYEDDVLRVMGSDCSVGHLRDGVVEYVWSVDGNSKHYLSGMRVGGMVMLGGRTNNTGSKSVTVYCEEGRVVEIRPHNI